ncbi:hypothetical protein FHP29_01115 [Nocardioides albidus]|uniref:Uncharacterized protein n=1 Tax=Nocardioides albidus TaxID=1517589 RepID=A0A5C4WPK4_9ACTN|nr:hypothetical protein [Nocardioides albidus]TNM50160.1 hypothetical protein FHP29_01115 [Nocardioides albidus]
MSYPPPHDPYRQQTERSAKLVGYLVGGLVIGPVLAVICPVAGLSVGSGLSTADNGYDGTPVAVGVVLGLLLPLLIPVPLLFGRGTRPWGVGILIGAALTMIILGGACAGLIYLFTQAES